MAHTIERVSPVPYYEQLYEILREQISQGDIAEEERLPSELELCREFGLSRATVRQTLTKLENDGYAHRIPRRGVFASVPGQTAGWTVQEGFLESQLRARTHRDHDGGRQDGLRHPRRPRGGCLRVGPGTEVFALERVRALDGRRAMYSTNWFPREVARTIASESGVLDGSASLNSHLRAAGFISSGAQRVIHHALAAPEAVAAHLDVETGHPVLRAILLVGGRRHALRLLRDVGAHRRHPPRGQRLGQLTGSSQHPADEAPARPPGRVHPPCGRREQGGPHGGDLRLEHGHRRRAVDRGLQRDPSGRTHPSPGHPDLGRATEVVPHRVDRIAPRHGQSAEHRGGAGPRILRASAAYDGCPPPRCPARTSPTPTAGGARPVRSTGAGSREPPRRRARPTARSAPAPPRAQRVLPAARMPGDVDVIVTAIRGAADWATTTSAVPIESSTAPGPSAARPTPDRVIVAACHGDGIRGHHTRRAEPGRHDLPHHVAGRHDGRQQGVVAEGGGHAIARPRPFGTAPRRRARREVSLRNARPVQETVGRSVRAIHAAARSAPRLSPRPPPTDERAHRSVSTSNVSSSTSPGAARRTRRDAAGRTTPVRA